MVTSALGNCPVYKNLGFLGDSPRSEGRVSQKAWEGVSLVPLECRRMACDPAQPWSHWTPPSDLPQSNQCSLCWGQGMLVHLCPQCWGKNESVMNEEINQWMTKCIEGCRKGHSLEVGKPYNLCDLGQLLHFFWLLMSFSERREPASTESHTGD